VPVALFIWHKFIQPLIDRWYGKPKLESGKEGDDVRKSGEKVSVRRPAGAKFSQSSWFA